MIESRLGPSIVAGLCLLIGGASLLQAPSASLDAMARDTAATEAASVNAVVAGLGVVEPDGGAVDLAAMMPGTVARVHVKEGDRVKKGDVLVELVNDDLKAKLAQAEAGLEIKAAALKRIRNGPRLQEIRQAEARLREEEGNLKLLQVQHERRRKLAREGAVSTESANTTENAFNAGVERRNAARQALSLLTDGARAEDLEAAAAEVRLAEQQVAEAAAAVARSVVRASTDGVVLRRYKEPGEAVSTQPAQALVQIGDLTRLVVRTQIDEDDIADLKLGQPATVTATALGGKTLTGRVIRISPRLGAKTITSGSPTEKRDARVLDVMVALDPGPALPIFLRVDVVIDVSADPIATSSLRSAPAGARPVRDAGGPPPARHRAVAAPPAAAPPAVVQEPAGLGAAWDLKL